MTALILDGRQIAKQLRAELPTEIDAFRQQSGRAPSLVVVQVEFDTASSHYVQTIAKLCTAVGVAYRLELLPHSVTQAGLEAEIEKLNSDNSVDGVLIQMPLPAHLSADLAIMRLDYRKDVDGIHPTNIGLLVRHNPFLVPNTPAGGIELMRRYQIEIAAKRAAVIGRSPVVGRPMADLLNHADATVTLCHKLTPDLAAVTRESDIVVLAAGHPGLVTGEMLKPGAVVIDFGTTVLDDGRLVGDVDFASAVEVASAITPVPGGTGPVTNQMLLRNVLTAARQRLV
jgi:methylenetetrahydrofolate dehydrogenase (NADP+)/methenyltetrahydrofolate cyclohydrolase